ncbi:MAG: tetratricopeptide repeat protein [Bryobacterales bacterium]|nr:tetratricopeptide repeat protein [Bryobacterales bacterium]
MDTDAQQSSSRLKALLSDNFSQHLSEDALKQFWQRVYGLARHHLVDHPLLGELTQRILLLLLALFMVSTLAGVLASSYWSQREQIARHEFERSRALNAQGQHARALRYLRSAAHLEHKNLEYQMALASTLIQLRRYDEARLQLHDLLRKDPTNAEANLRLARISSEEGDDKLDITVQYFQRAIYGLWPTNPPENRIRTRFELVDYLASQDRLELLRAELIVLASDLRDEPEHLERTGFLMLYAKAPENALAVFQRFLALAPSDVRAFAGIGKAYLEMGNFPAAEQWLQRAFRLNPSNAAIEADLALVREVRALNPVTRGLSRGARGSRMNALLAMNYQPLYACATSRTLDEEVQQDLTRARQHLEQKRALQPTDEELEADLSLARELYQHFNTHCKVEEAPEILHRLMALLAVN